MLLQLHKNVLPASIAIIGGMIFAVGQPQFDFVTNQDSCKLAFTPNERPKPQRTQGGGSRNYEVPHTNSLSAINS